MGWEGRGGGFVFWKSADAKAFVLVEVKNGRGGWRVKIERREGEEEGEERRGEGWENREREVRERGRGSDRRGRGAVWGV